MTTFGLNTVTVLTVYLRAIKNQDGLVKIWTKPSSSKRSCMVFDYSIPANMIEAEVIRNEVIRQCLPHGGHSSPYLQQNKNQQLFIPE